MDYDIISKHSSFMPTDQSIVIVKIILAYCLNFILCLNECNIRVIFSLNDDNKSHKGSLIAYHLSTFPKTVRF